MPHDREEEVALAFEYHRRSKHHLQRYAEGPATLDWDAQPDPFRCFAGADQFRLPLHADTINTTYRQLYTAGAITPATITEEHIGIFFELSFALSAWKHYGDARWSLRCNPSSGNLHPSEVYAILPQAAGTIRAGIYHYRSDHHALERRCRFSGPDNGQTPPGRFLLGLTTIAWREAWKYGERAFRYCQLDIGHAIACAGYAAKALGWQTRVLAHPGDEQLEVLIGLDRAQDFQQGEPETAELLIEVTSAATDKADTDLIGLLARARQGEWHGQANLLDPKPMYTWPIIDQITHATRKPSTPDILPRHRTLQTPHPVPSRETSMSTLIRQRRSAQAYDGQTGMSMRDFSRMLDALLPYSGVPVWNGWPHPARIHPVFFVHRVEGLAPGLYLQVRDPAVLGRLREQLHPQFDWTTPEAGFAQPSLDQSGFYHLISAKAQTAARRLACHQDIASNGAFSVAMLADFSAQVEVDVWRYRQLFHEAGMLGQVLYIEAEASELRGTGIGCFFDDAVHEILGIHDERWQCLYQFTIGGALDDPRLVQEAPYGAS